MYKINLYIYIKNKFKLNYLLILFNSIDINNNK